MSLVGKDNKDQSIPQSFRRHQLPYNLSQHRIEITPSVHRDLLCNQRVGLHWLWSSIRQSNKFTGIASSPWILHWIQYIAYQLGQQCRLNIERVVKADLPRSSCNCNRYYLKWYCSLIYQIIIMDCQCCTLHAAWKRNQDQNGHRYLSYFIQTLWYMRKVKNSRKNEQWPKNGSLCEESMKNWPMLVWEESEKQKQKTNENIIQ